MTDRRGRLSWRPRHRHFRLALGRATAASHRDAATPDRLYARTYSTRARSQFLQEPWRQPIKHKIVRVVTHDAEEGSNIRSPAD